MRNLLHETISIKSPRELYPIQMCIYLATSSKGIEVKALVALLIGTEFFLNSNGFELVLSDDEMFEIAIKVAKKQIGEEKLAIILKDHCVRNEGLIVPQGH